MIDGQKRTKSMGKNFSSLTCTSAHRYHHIDLFGNFEVLHTAAHRASKVNLGVISTFEWSTQNSNILSTCLGKAIMVRLNTEFATFSTLVTSLISRPSGVQS